jgi:D-methionine transport system permease protein
VAEVIGHGVPPATLARLPAPGAGEVRRLAQVIFSGPHATRAVVSEASRDFGIDVNIVSGRVDEIAGEPFGVMALAAYGAEDRVGAAFDWMRGLGLTSRTSRMSWLTPTLQDLLVEALWETAIMVGASAAIAVAFGLPLALLLHVTAPGGLSPNAWLNRPLGLVVNAARSTPFIILMVAIVPFTRLGRRHLDRHGSGDRAAGARRHRLPGPPVRERAARGRCRRDRGGARHGRHAAADRRQVLVPEALPGLIAATTVALVSLVGFSAMAGAVGGGGLGDLGIRFGYQRFMPEVMATVVVILIVLVQGLQSFGDWLVRRLSH